MLDMRERILSLSPRQLEVMQLVARRLSSKEIGLRLGLSPATVDSHIAAALQRMGLGSRRDAGLQIIICGFATEPVGDPMEEPTTEIPPGVHHGGDHPYPPRGIASGPSNRISTSRRRSRGEFSEGKADGLPSRSINTGMARVVVRYLFDGFYIILFFAVMSAVALGVHWVVIQCEQRQVDPVVLFILKGVSYVLVGLDAVGVVTATGFLTYRFIRAIGKVDG